MSTPARVRFAPSPTGNLHVGSIRSGLFNYLWARHTGGVFVLRIEDTDQARLVEGTIDQINDSLEALGIAPDEGPRQGGEFGPYLQSERLKIYLSHSEQLLKSGALYRCWCTSDRLSDLRRAAQTSGVAFKYDRHCLNDQNSKNPNEPHVLRFKIPENPSVISWDDAVRGHMEFSTSELDDFVALKSDGYPTYHLANVIDDHLMQISHVLRADEWLPSTPKHLLLFDAFGWSKPTYAHLPPVLGPDGKKKLSKRDGAAPVEEYIDSGYLAEALMSFLASLGWNDGSTQEVYSPSELIQNFTLDRIQKSPAKFDKDRLTWINGFIIRQMPLSQLIERCKGFWPADADSSTAEYKLQVLELVHERLKFLSELPELTTFFFTDPDVSYDPATAELLRLAVTALENCDFSKSELETRLRGLAEELKIRPGTLFSAIRIAITGKKAAPGIFETLHVLGQTASLRRLKLASKSQQV